jgi:nucleoside-diphosphate-sugar epimerase
MASACVAVITADRERVHSEAFNVGSTDANYLVRDLAAVVADVVPGTGVTIAPGAGADRRSYRVDFSKIASTVPAWKPEWDARRGAEQLRRAYAAAELDATVFHGDRFARLARIKTLLDAGELNDDLRWKVAAPA